MTSFTRMRWTGVDPISPLAPGSEAQWARVQDLLVELNRERAGLARECAAIEDVRRSLIGVQRERRGVRTLANVKWMCIGGSISWVAFILMSL